MSKNDEAAIQSIRALLNDPRWEHRSFEKIRDRFEGISDDELRRLLVAAGATSKKSGDGLELWSLEGQMAERHGQNLRETTGRTIPDLILGIPVWLLGIAAVVFVIIVGYAMLFAKERVSLGFLGEWGPVSATSTSGAEIPSGAVIAFASSETQPCPGDDWKLFEEAKGRFIVGAGHGNRSELTPRQVGDIGGEESVAITLEEMPWHQHPMGIERGQGSGEAYPYMRPASGSGQTTEGIGGLPDHATKPHNNMPPYVALYFCKKD